LRKRLPAERAAAKSRWTFRCKPSSIRAFEPAHFNRMIEREVMRLRGIKSLYSDSFFTSQEFAGAYGRAEYEQLKVRYDPHHHAPHLYDKCVRRG
jgi:hypothetical protein